MDPGYRHRYRELYRSHWWWRARERLVVDVLRELNLRMGAAALDVGCGDGLLFPRLEELGTIGTIRGIEIDRDLLDPHGPYQDRIHTEPLGHESYRSWRIDLITALDVLEHVDDDHAAVAEMARLLRPGGYLVLTVPAFMSLWSHHDDINHHRRRYCTERVRALLEPHGETLQLRYLFHALYVPKRLVAALEWLRRRLGGANRASNAAIRQHALPPAPLNELLRACCYWESRLLRPLRLPLGTSILAVMRRKERGS